jgi:hypothetical protein
LPHRIVEIRRKNGRFKKIEELRQLAALMLPVAHPSGRSHGTERPAKHATAKRTHKAQSTPAKYLVGAMRLRPPLCAAQDADEEDGVSST